MGRVVLTVFEMLKNLIVLLCASGGVSARHIPCSHSNAVVLYACVPVYGLKS